MSERPDEGFKVTDRRRREDQPSQSHETTPSEPAGAPSRDAAGQHRSLADLFMMLATEALIALGDAPDPATGQRTRDVPRAAEVIDLLLLLREKTEGNRTVDETQILGQLLYDLQLRYVRATKSAG